MPAKPIAVFLFTLMTSGQFSSASAAMIRVPQDHPSIQQAIGAAASGDTVIVSAGIYKERLQLKSGVTVKSAGDSTTGKLGLSRAEATIIDGGGNEGTGAGVTMAQGSTLDGFTVTNVGVYDEAAWNKHHATQGNEQQHEPIGQPGDSGIAVTGVSCTIKNNIVHHIGHSGIEIQGVAAMACSPHVYRNVCYRNMGGGIGSMKKSTAVIEANVCFQNFYAGIGHHNASPTVIENVCYENIRAGIGISEGACPVVRGNQCYKNRRAGIGIRSGANTKPVIEDNDCYENDMAGIGSEEMASPLIRNNRCYQNKLAGIGSRSHATPTIIGNECYKNEQAGIGQQSDAITTLINNHCHHNKAAGIGFEKCKAGQSTVTNNRLIDNALVAIGINAGWTVRISGNEMSREGGLPPIAMVFAGADATFTNNVIRGGGVAGIRVTGKVRAEDNEFAGTHLRKVGPPNFAIWALPGSDVTLIDNKIHGWRHGLHATGSKVTAIKNTVEDFHGAAIVIQDSNPPADVFGNRAISKNAKDKVVSVSGDSGVIAENTLLEQR